MFIDILRKRSNKVVEKKVSLRYTTIDRSEIMGDWGIGKFITFVIIFIIAIMAFIINVKKLGIDVNTGLPVEINTGSNTNTGTNTHNNNPVNVSAKTYSDLESQVELATKSHLAKYYTSL